MSPHATEREVPVSSAAAVPTTLSAILLACGRTVAVAALASAGFASAASARAAAPPAASTLTCRTVAVDAVHGGPIPGRSQLSQIVHGKVLSMNPNTGTTSMVRFARHSGRWLRSPSGARYAMAGQAISRDGRPGGSYVIAARLGSNRTVLCAKASALQVFAADTAAAEPAATQLPASGVEETPGSSRNVARLLENHSTQTICLTTPVHPDGAPRVSHPSSGIWCYRGRGAWLNDQYGTERQTPEAPVYGAYFTDVIHTHRIVYNNAVVPAAKRPNAKPNGEAILNSPIAWRAYSPSFRFPAGP